MEPMVLNGLLWVMALSSGLMAGVYFAFSAFIMQSLASLPGNAGAAAMNAINRVILKSLFMLLFWGSTIVSALLLGFGLWRLAVSDLAPALVGATYFGGMFLVTATRNVPLNNALAAGEERPEVWQDYLRRWTYWNSFRTVACLVTCALAILLLTLP